MMLLFRFLAEERNRIFEGMREWENKTCIRFYERPEGHNESYINIFKGAGYVAYNMTIHGCVQYVILNTY